MVSKKEFLNRIKDTDADWFDIVGNYVNLNTKIKVKCKNPECGFEKEALPKELQNSKGCPRCGKGRYWRKTSEDFLIVWKKEEIQM